MIQRITRHIIVPIFSRYRKFRSSIFGLVVFVISILSVILFLSFGAIFRSVYGEYLKTVIHQNANNVGSVVEGALYHSMLENNKGQLQNTLDVINNMSGIDEVNLYNEHNKLVYTSFSTGDANNSYPDCVSCHAEMAALFPEKEKAYRIIDLQSGCNMSASADQGRHLLIRSPILNQPSCYTSKCHAHSPDEEVLGSLIIKSSLSNLDEAVSKSTTEFFFLTIAVTLLLGLFLILFARQKIHKPLHKLTLASVAVARGDKTVRMVPGSNMLFDINLMAKAFNDMLDKLHAASNELENWSQQLEYKVQKKSEELINAQNEMIHIERIASLGKLSASVAHELNNPLSGILIYSKLLHKQINNLSLDEPQKTAFLKHLKYIQNETKRCGDIVKGLLDFSKKDQSDFEVKHLHEVLRETCRIVDHSMKLTNISFLTDYQATDDRINCNAGQIKQACVAIIVNATEAVVENGEIVMRTTSPDDQHLCLEICDNGSGISEENISHVFEPFFSTKHQTSGIGLGLAIVHGIVQSHKGKIDISSKQGQGTCIAITFPIIKN